MTSTRRFAALALPSLVVVAIGCGSDDANLIDSDPQSPLPGAADAGTSPPSASDAGAGARRDAGVTSSDAGAVAADAASADTASADSGNPVPNVPYNPFVVTAHDPFSTFAADVDSASYDIFVKSLDELDRLPALATVRSEEFVNFFRYDYPEPTVTSTQPFSVSLDVGPVPTSSTVLLRIGVQGRDLLADRARANLVFLLDVSGSMRAPDKLPLVKQMMSDALDVLRPDDTIAIVTYSGRVDRALPPTRVARASEIRAVLDGLVAGGSTAGGAALELAYQQAEAGFVTGGINHILLCTDGDFNVGVTSTDGLLAFVESRRSTGVTFTALGFGLRILRDELMEAISNAGNGIYRVISGPKTALRYVEQRLLSDVVHIAKDVKLQVEFNPDYVFAYRQLGYENRQLADSEFRDDRVDAGEIGSGHQMTALYELALTPEALPPSGPPLDQGPPVEGEREIASDAWVMVKVRHKPPGASVDDPATEMRQSLVDGNFGLGLDGESRFAWSVATLASHLRFDPHETPARLEAARAIAAEAPSTNEERSDFARLFDRAMRLLP